VAFQPLALEDLGGLLLEDGSGLILLESSDLTDVLVRVGPAGFASSSRPSTFAAPHRSTSVGVEGVHFASTSRPTIHAAPHRSD
jgi:hypothetical protein